MFRKLATILIMIILMSTVTNADIAFYGLQMPSPEHNNTWDNALGVEAQYRMPIDNGPLSLGLSVGVSQYDSEDYSSSSTSGYMFFGHFIPTSTERIEITGDAQAFSLGVSLLYEIPICNNINLVAEAGVKHHIMSSDVERTVNTTTRSLFGPDVTNTMVTSLEYDNPTTCELGANLEFDLAENVAGLIGAMYIFDLNHDHVSSVGQPLGLTNGLEGTVFRAGLVIRTE